MSEIVCLQVGQCGNQVGTSFWEMLCNEHNISSDGIIADWDEELKRDKRHVYFHDIQTGRAIPRCVLVDLEPGTLDRVRSGVFGHLFSPDNFIFGASGASNNWAKGHCTDGAELAENIMDTVRRETEKCDALQGLQLVHSLGGGTGSGLGSLIMSRLKEEYPDRLTVNFSVTPSPKVSDNVVEPYNAVLSIHELIDLSDMSIILDNEALYDLCIHRERVVSPTYGHLNELISRAMSGATATLRFPGQLNASLRKLAVNLVPFPRLHFLITGVAPLRSESEREFEEGRVSGLLRQLFSNRGLMCGTDIHHGRYLSCALLFRGSFLSFAEVDRSVHSVTERESALFCPFIPQSVIYSLCPVNEYKAVSASSATLLGNSTAVTALWERLREQFLVMYRRKAFLHWYLGEGLEQSVFDDALSNLTDLISEYQQYQESEMESEEGIGDIVSSLSLYDQSLQSGDSKSYTEYPSRRRLHSPR